MGIPALLEIQDTREILVPPATRDTRVISAQRDTPDTRVPVVLPEKLDIPDIRDKHRPATRDLKESQVRPDTRDTLETGTRDPRASRDRRGLEASQGDPRGILDIPVQELSPDTRGTLGQSGTAALAILAMGTPDTRDTQAIRAIRAPASQVIRDTPAPGTSRDTRDTPGQGLSRDTRDTQAILDQASRAIPDTRDRAASLAIRGIRDIPGTQATRDLVLLPAIRGIPDPRLRATPDIQDTRDTRD